MSSTSETESSDDESAVKRQRLQEACAPGWSTGSGKSEVNATSSRTSTAKVEVDDPGDDLLLYFVKIMVCNLQIDCTCQVVYAMRPRADWAS